ncbi:hypothetical protein M427DRAFT_309909 [Gonapodya prolifera JEL478]|uniref:Uncharacterized protein n=1 Tax=Gonapodya prolifera (strain JEL478) TaxID=1344416 RepID=A0A139AGA0_GONPJ|nr:hypothetical protein M427DRAFT_309909 [Gonapodya prolifera JEL478]|eukprot:KXS15852.1 hypothetical protein M427DRAFT_309909 [Gonapodya prolifera JEL478]
MMMSRDAEVHATVPPGSPVGSPESPGHDSAGSPEGESPVHSDSSPERHLIRDLCVQIAELRLDLALQRANDTSGPPPSQKDASRRRVPSTKAQLMYSSASGAAATGMVSIQKVSKKESDSRLVAEDAAAIYRSWAYVERERAIRLQESDEDRAVVLEDELSWSKHAIAELQRTLQAAELRFQGEREYYSGELVMSFEERIAVEKDITLLEESLRASITQVNEQ